MTVEGREVLYSRSKQKVAVINPDGGGSSGESAVGAVGPLERPEEELDSEAACAFGEKTMPGTAKDWAAA